VHFVPGVISEIQLPNGVTTVFNFGEKYELNLHSRFQYQDSVEATKRISKQYTNSGTWVF